LILRPGDEPAHEFLDGRRPYVGIALFNGMNHGASHHGSIGVQLDFADLRRGGDSKSNG
jgi:hypothetical protein